MTGIIDTGWRPATAEDTRACYALFLLRDPENEAVVASKDGLTLETCVRAFVESPEFDDRVAALASGRLAPERVLGRCSEPLHAWADEVFGPTDAAEPALAAVLGHALVHLAVSGILGRPPQPLLYAARALARLADGDALGPFRIEALAPLRDATIAAFLAARDPVAADAQGAGLALLDAAEGLPPGAGVADLPLRKALRLAFGGGESSPDLARDGELIARSGLFDADWYAAQHPEVGASGMAPLQHFLLRGAAAGLSPSPLFSSSHYLAHAPDLAGQRINPLTHYLQTGWTEGRNPGPAFDVDWYRRRHLREQAGVEPLGHYLRAGMAEGLRAHPLFDRDFYFRRYPDLVGSGMDPYIHWAKHGRSEGRVGIDAATLGDTLSVAVVAHVFYEDLWPELLARLRTIPHGFDLFATVPEGSSLAAQIAEDWPGARVLEVDNRGRDIGPFLCVLPELVERGYDLLCKLHTKRGATEPDTWRFLMLEGLLGSRPFVRQLLGWFEHDPDLVLVGPDAFFLDGPRFIGDNGPAVAALLRRCCGEAAELPARWGFFAGSMFWARPALLRPLLALDPDQLFEAENTARDGQAAHAIERLIGVLAALGPDNRIGLSDMSGNKVGPELDVARAPHRLVWDELAETLPVRTSSLAQRVPTLRRAPRRAWLAPPGAALGVTFVGPVEAVHGLGVSARGFVDALAATGHPLHVVKWRPGFDRVRMREVDVLTQGEQAINLVHLNLDLLHSARLLDQTPLDRLLSPDRYNVAIISWELLAIDPRWAETIHRFDEIWASSRFMVRAIEAVSAVPVRVVRPALDHPAADREPLPIALPDDRTVFFYGADFGSVPQRKNPEAFWRAYAQEFGPEDGALCLLKLHYPNPDHALVQEAAALAAERPDVMLLTESLSDGEMAALFDRIDCYVSPHRAEGLGLTMLEAMRAGKPVIATGWSGEADFVRDDTALLLDYRLIEVGPGADPYPAGAVWADPSIASLRAQMRAVLADPATARARGERGRARFAELFSREAAGAGMEAELQRIWRRGGGAATAAAGDLARRA